jgi:hypothetical protein
MLRTIFPNARYVLLDANVLVVLIAGQVRPNLIARLSPGSSGLGEEDFEIILGLLDHFEATITTPYVLTEVNGLLNKLDSNSATECRAKLAEYIPLMEPRYTEPKVLAAHEQFATFGIADVSILYASDHTLIVTADGPLVGFLPNTISVLEYQQWKHILKNNV